MIAFGWFTTKTLLGFMVDLSQLGLQTNEHHGGVVLHETVRIPGCNQDKTRLDRQGYQWYLKHRRRTGESSFEGA